MRERNRFFVMTLIIIAKAAGINTNDNMPTTYIVVFVSLRSTAALTLLAGLAWLPCSIMSAILLLWRRRTWIDFIWRMMITDNARGINVKVMTWVTSDVINPTLLRHESKIDASHTNIQAKRALRRVTHTLYWKETLMARKRSMLTMQRFRTVAL